MLIISGNYCITGDPLAEGNNLKKIKRTRIIFDIYDNGEIKLSVEGKLDPSILADLMAKIALTSQNSGSFSLIQSSFTSISDKLWQLIHTRFRGVWFTSSELRKVYFEVFGEELPKNKASTYLYRFYTSGRLLRKEGRPAYKYKLAMVKTLD